MKTLIVFDLDGTLAQSKAAIDDEMRALLAGLLGVPHVQVSVISGGDWPQFETQLLANLPQGADLTKLSLLPTCGTRFYRYAGAGWNKLYSEDLNPEQKARIVAALNKEVAASGFAATKTWDPDFSKRMKIKAALDLDLPDFSVRLGGTTSIDITLPGIDKAYGIRKLRDILGIPIEEMLYVGDALFPGGNDAPVRETGAVCIQVRDPDETKRVIETVIACES